MPHADLHYSPDIDLNAADILAEVEKIILNHDAGSGHCKGRAYRADVAHHTHAKLTVNMLSKDHRDAAFLDALTQDLRALLSRHLPRPCWLSIDITFSGPAYLTEILE